MKNLKLYIGKIGFVIALLCVLSFGVSAYIQPDSNTNAPNPNSFQPDCWWYCASGGWGSASVPCGHLCDYEILQACGGPAMFQSCP